MRVLIALACLTVAAAAAVSAASPPPAAAPNSSEQKFFESKIRPLLAKQCFGCHGEIQAKGDLRLDTAAAFWKGGKSGRLTAGKDPAASLLIQAVDYRHALKMPPSGKMSAGEIADLTRWVTMGAPWPESAPAGGPRRTGEITEEDRRFWAYQPVRKPSVPQVKNRGFVRGPIDAFVLAGLESEGLQPAAEADRRTLIRRATFDLTGLPPTPEEVRQFVEDPSPDAYSRLIDRLLASPAYGERWGRHWLDVARYADSNGLDENTAMANAWRYRDWVIASLNADKPYDDFVREQIAGDLLPPPADRQEEYNRLIATGFLALGPKVLAEPDTQKMLLDIADEQIDVVGKAFLGLTVSCARCHDHKFDPIPTKDYYALAGIFRSTRTLAKESRVAQVMERPLAPPEEVARYRDFEKRRRELDEQVKKAQGTERHKELQKQLKDLDAARPAELPMAVAVEDAAKVQDLQVHLRGNYLTLGEPAPRGFLQIVSHRNQPPLRPNSSGRLELANWIASESNPLTARVMVNRIWRGHFGAGLVKSVDNFGHLGDRPSHPELLDWLSARFMEEGWSLKAMHRLIMNSSVYRMSSSPNEKAALIDPDNRLLWRFNRRRLEAEAIRDSFYAVAGTLDRTPGGTLLKTPNFGYVTNDQSNNQAQYDVERRSIYLPVIRNAVFDVFQVWDFVEPSYLNGDRSTTTVAPQALFLLNSDMVLQQSSRFARRVMREARGDGARIRLAYEIAFGRLPDAAEVARGIEFLRRYEKALPAAAGGSAAPRYERAWAAYCQALFAASEFVTIN